ncbi:MAG: hypothetical protein A3B25_02440 [Candidatus Ryanbacteria bacterium RIFCSPLOWO2_01_FULL_48_26]|uniref:Uncharacterized protein n=1 Tax=Candidatus Ryanbacteria bacterium RIFCSPLOWO2_01_FULL_48_26 TaxID=1802126 RepID=A0A1G2GWM5_9BACT|nr:MAG: hypothetical protein A3B25_02440 [Candidatus Ryanbacteria bacterium RIFCSPLOWO2_01_FULL_48_26]
MIQNLGYAITVIMALTLGIISLAAMLNAARSLSEELAAGARKTNAQIPAQFTTTRQPGQSTTYTTSFATTKTCVLCRAPIMEGVPLCDECSEPLAR